MSRRRLLQTGLAGGFVLLAGGGAYALSGRGMPPLVRAARPVMGTTATIVAAHPQPEAGRAVAAALDALQDVERRMTRFLADSEVGRINTAPGVARPVSASTAEVMASALALAAASDGYFEPGLGRQEALWGFYDHQAPERLPAGWWRREPAWRTIRLETDDTPRVTLTDPTVRLDLGGIAKGYGVDRAVAVLREAGVEHALVNVGGDLYALGSRPGGEPWRVGVRHPRRDDRFLAVMRLRDQAVATSGDYENFFMRAGRRYSHLLDPRTARPAPYHQSVTVTAPSVMEADALATAAFVAEPDAAQRTLRRMASGPWMRVEQGGRTLRSTSFPS